VVRRWNDRRSRGRRNHRRSERHRSWLTSALIPYAFIFVLGIGLVVMVPANEAAAALRSVPGAVQIGHVEASSGPRRVRWVSR